MKTCQYVGEPFDEPRSHPWVDVEGRPDCRYYDLTASPALIRTSLEDFRPWDRYPAVGDFYRLLEWMNRPGCALESNDCEFTGPEVSEISSVAKALVCSGRLMLLFRALPRNVAPGQIVALEQRLHRHLMDLDPDFEWGMIGTTRVPVRYRALPADAQRGEQLMISFWAWGDTRSEAMLHLRRLFESLSDALHEVAADVAVA